MKKFLSFKHMVQSLFVNPAIMDSLVLPGEDYSFRDFSLPSSRAEDERRYTLNTKLPVKYVEWIPGEEKYEWGRKAKTFLDVVTEYAEANDITFLQIASDDQSPGLVTEMMAAATVTDPWFIPDNFKDSQFVAIIDANIFDDIMNDKEFKHIFTVKELEFDGEKYVVAYEFASDTRANAEKERQDTLALPVPQFMVAYILAKHFHHTWAGLVTNKVCQGQFQWTLRDITMLTTETSYYDDFGAVYPELDRVDCLVHTSGRNRVSWRIYPGGDLYANIARPECPEAIQVHIAPGGDVTLKYNENVKLYERHQRFLHWFLSAFYPTCHVEQVIMKDFPINYDEEEDIDEEEGEGEQCI